MNDEEKNSNANEHLQVSEQDTEQDTEQETKQTTTSSQKKRSYNLKHVWLGIGILAILHLVLFLFPMGFFFIGIVQIVYLIPAMVIFNKSTGIIQGLAIGAGITFLLNAACFGLFFSGVLY